MAAVGLDITRPILDWCANGEPPGPSGMCPDGDPARPRRGRGLGRLGAVLHRDVPAARRPQRLDRRDVQPDRPGLRAARHDAATGARPARPPARPVRAHLVHAAVRLREPRDLLCDELEFVPTRRDNAPRPDAARRRSTTAKTGCASTRTRTYPAGAGQRSDPEANRLVDWLLDQRGRCRGAEAGRRPSTARRSRRART